MVSVCRKLRHYKELVQNDEFDRAIAAVKLLIDGFEREMDKVDGSAERKVSKFLINLQKLQIKLMRQSDDAVDMIERLIETLESSTNGHGTSDPDSFDLNRVADHKAMDPEIFHKIMESSGGEEDEQDFVQQEEFDRLQDQVMALEVRMDKLENNG